MSYSRTFTNQRIRLLDIIDDSGIISDTLFSECTIVGPAILLIMDPTVQLASNAFAATSMNQVFWEVAESRSAVIGAIGLTNCRFEKCEMIRIGIAGPRKVGELLGVSRATAASQDAPPNPMGSFIEIGEGATVIGSLLIRAEGRGGAPGRRQRRQAAVAAAGAAALVTMTASSVAACSMGSARPAPGAAPLATTAARPVPPG